MYILAEGKPSEIKILNNMSAIEYESLLVTFHLIQHEKEQAIKNQK